LSPLAKPIARKARLNCGKLEASFLGTERGNLICEFQSPLETNRRKRTLVKPNGQFLKS